MNSIRCFLFGNAVYEHLIPLLSNRTLNDQNGGLVFVREMNSSHLGDFTGFDVIQSDFVPNNTQVFALSIGMNLSEIQPNDNDNIFIIDYWTFINSESMDMAMGLVQN